MNINELLQNAQDKNNFMEEEVWRIVREMSKEEDLRTLKHPLGALNSPSYNQQLLSYSGRHESKQKLVNWLDDVLRNRAVRHEDPTKYISRNELKVAAANCKFSLETPPTHTTPSITPPSSRDITPNSTPNASRSPSPSSNNRRRNNKDLVLVVV